jgi:hypothetical protein
MAEPKATAPIIMDLERVNRTPPCPSCNHPFSLGDSAVLACGLWEGGLRYVHANEAVWDPKSGSYVERACWNSQRGN